MSDKKLLFIVNPRSGRASIRTHLLEALEIFTRAGYFITTYITQGSADATEAVIKYGGDCDLIVGSGGDGTINELVNGLMRLPRKVPFAILPAGTTNDYAYTLGIPTTIADAAETAVKGRLFNLDLGLFNGRYFNYIAAFGLFTEVTYETPQEVKNVLGMAAYALDGAKRILDIKTHKIRLEHDGGVIEDEVILALFSNTVSVAGLRTAFTDARLDDGKLEVTLIRPPKTVVDIQTIINILLDFENMREVESDFLTHITTSRAVLTSESEIKWTLDGESGGLCTRAEISCVHLAATVVAGKKES